MIKNVTNQVEFGNNDDEALPLTKCVCGKIFNMWDFFISIYDDPEWSHVCPNCGTKLYFRNEIQVYQIIEDDKE